MLLEFTCTNYKSIGDRIRLSMLASSDDTREEDLIHFDKYRVNRMSAIYGPNGSGKTNVLDAMIFAKNLVIFSMRREPGDDLDVNVYKLSGYHEPTEFTFQYVMNGTRFAYGFSILHDKIDEEYLYYFPNKRQAKIFSRKGLKVEGGDGFRKFSDSSLEALKDNRLFLSCAANYTSSVDIENAFLFFKTDLRSFWPALGNDESAMLRSAIKYMTENPEQKHNYLRIVNYLGTGISDIKTRYEKRKFTANELPESMPAGIREYLMGKESPVSEATIYYDKFSTDLATEESTGIRKMFAFLYPYLDVLQHGRVLICDEIETGLHESIVMGLLQLFSRLYPENNAQIIFSTHDTSLLDSNLFRRDQVWFTELDENRMTDLYSLAEIHNVRKTENLKKGYISGKYGAIPMLNSTFVDELLKETEAESAAEEGTYGL